MEIKMYVENNNTGVQFGETIVVSLSQKLSKEKIKELCEILITGLNLSEFQTFKFTPEALLENSTPWKVLNIKIPGVKEKEKNSTLTATINEFGIAKAM